MKSSKLAINLLETNIQMSYLRDTSAANVEALVRRIHEFFTQNERIFSDEFKRLLG